MKKTVEIMGLPIISVSEGIELGTAQCLVIDGAQRKLVALAVDDGKWYKAAKLLPLTDVLGIGESAITVEASDKIVALEQAPELEKLLEAGVSIVGTRVLSKGGQWLGIVEEITLDENSGAIVSLAIESDSDGAVEAVAADRVYTFAKEVTIISDAAKAAPLAAAPELAKPAAVIQAPPAPEAAAVAVEPVEAAAADDAAHKIEEKSKRFMIGKKATRKIQTDSGLVIVEQGGEITEEVIQKAKLANKFVELTMSVQ